MIRRKRGPHEGRVAFVNEPFPHHVPMVEKRGQFVPDYKRRLIWDGEKFVSYKNGDPTHLMRYHVRHVEIETVP